jgi:glutamate formiminotransferase / formiminotetrahydrofolate cyclodeaminase
MPQLVECVPNFSDGRRPEVYNTIADAIRTVEGVRVLDVSPDPDHNRTVITFAGEPAAVEEAAFQAIAQAAQLINLEQHQGEHPRIGATDVCPFIPIKGITAVECVEMAKRLGQRVGAELGIAVYLYGSAATRPDRESLSSIRQGEYEKWRDEVATDPGRKPDYGPAVAKPWGATVIGVRPFLVAYNLYLNSDNVDVANEIARAIRFTTGGLRYVQALGFLVDGKAQVSMNLTDFEKTPIHRVQEMVRREAARYGLTITKAELVGLIPQKALLETVKWYLQLDDFKEQQVLEIKLQESEETAAREKGIHDFLDSVASATPAPGGGSVAALAGALGASLAQMVAGLTAGRKKYATVDQEARAALNRAAELRQALATAIVEDSAAFEDLMAAMKNKSLTETEREAAVQEATRVAAEVPLRVARLALEAAGLAAQMTRLGNSNAVTDAAAGGLMACAAVQIAALNVKINTLSLTDRTVAQTMLDEIGRLEAEANALAETITSTAAERGGF